MRRRPLLQRDQVLSRVHVPPGREERERNGENPAARGRVPENLRGAPCKAPEQAFVRQGEADQVIPSVRGGAEHDLCSGGKFPECLPDPCGGERRAVGSHDDHASRPLPERGRRCVPHPVPEVPAALREAFEPGKRRAPQGILRVRRIEEEVSTHPGQGADFGRRIPEHAGVQARRCAGVERRAEAGLDPAGTRGLRHQHDRLFQMPSSTFPPRPPCHSTGVPPPRSPRGPQIATVMENR